MNKKVYNAFSCIEVFQNTANKTLLELVDHASFKCYPKGSILYSDKETLSMIYFVISGFVSLYKLNEHGEKKVIFVLGKGKLINEIPSIVRAESIHCEIFEEAVILSIERQYLLRAMENDFELTKSILDEQAIKIRRLYRQLKNTSGSIRGDKKLAAKLWKLSNDFGKALEGGIIIDLDIRITYLADMLGAKRETVSRQFHKLSKQGLVIMKNNRFFIPDKDALAKYFKQP